MSTTVTDSTSTASTSSSTTSSSSNTTVTKNDFLKLLIAQMKNQDPLNPMDGTQYVSELAQFSSLEELQNMNDNLNTSINANYTLTQSINNTLASNLIGKDVKVTSSTVTYSGQSSADIGYTLPSKASDVTLTITNSSGSVVRTMTGLSTTSGDNKLSWDFTDNNGSTLPEGTYTFAVSATNSSGTSLTTSLFKQGTIDAVNYTSSGTTFTVDGSDYNLSDVLEIMGSTSSGGN
jgi:flagellar basal-body rod modification protein FlgD